MANEKTINEFNSAVERVRTQIRAMEQPGLLPSVVQAKYDLAATEIASMEDEHLDRVDRDRFYGLKNELEHAYQVSMWQSEEEFNQDDDGYPRNESAPEPAPDSPEKSGEQKTDREKIEDSERRRREEQNQSQQERSQEAERQRKEREKEESDRRRGKIKKKAKDKAAKKGWRKVLLQFLGTSLPWILLAAAIAVVLMIIIFAILGAIKSGANGSTPNQPVGSASDSTILQKTLIASGDKEIGSGITDTVMADLQRNLADLGDKTDDPTAKGKTEEIVQKIDRFLLGHDSALGKEIIADIRAILPQIAQQIPKIGVPTRQPVSTILGFNENLHYGTPLRPEVRTDNLEHGTYMYYGQGIADAVDLFVEKDSDVYPIFAGKIIDISDDGTGNQKIVIQNGDYELLMAQIKIQDSIKVGQNITTSQSIGKVAEVEGFNEIHIELAYQGKPVVTTALDKIDYLSNDKLDWGAYLWNHIKEAMNLQ